MIRATNGKLYGTASYDGGIFEINPNTFAYTTRYVLGGLDGYTPYASVLEASNGKLYGLTINGGLSDNGVLYEFDIYTNEYIKLYEFDGINGAHPLGSLLQASNGKLYGMTQDGGTANYGVLFEFDPNTDIYHKKIDFLGPNGKHPQGHLIQANNGKIYGMTTEGGADNVGTLFEFNISNGSHSILYSFLESYTCVNNYCWGLGNNPWGGMIQASNGKLYGLTASGGTKDGIFSFGVLFEFDLDSNLYTPKQYYETSTPGSLIQASNGKLYGTTIGFYADLGKIFEYDIPSNSSSYLYSFTGLDGSNPARSALLETTCSLVIDASSTPVSCYGQSDGSISTMVSGSISTVNYSIQPGGSSNTNGTFSSLGAGTYQIYATDNSGCTVSSKVIVEAPHQLEVLSTVPQQGSVGDSVLIKVISSGTIDSVFFNGLTASFTVNNDSQITAAVPIGASSGLISVWSEGCTDTSTDTFFVVPPPVVLEVKIFIEGLYRGNGSMVPLLYNLGLNGNSNVVDTAWVDLHNAVYPFELLNSKSTLIYSNGSGFVQFLDTVLGQSYYLVIRHRSSLETWSSQPVSFNSLSVSYFFTDVISKAFGNNMRDLGDGKFAIYSGDVNQDGTISSLDLSFIENSILIPSGGYDNNDLNGDGITESADYSLQENNLSLSKMNPANTYSDISICNQLWMNRNLDVSTYRNGDPIPEVSNPALWATLTTGAWCYYDNNPANGAIYGKLYNWYAVTDSRGLAPAGWHVPSHTEWNILENCLGTTTDGGCMLKETGTLHWESPNACATNSTGFTALPGGIGGVVFNILGINGFWWSSTICPIFGTDDIAWVRVLFHSTTYMDTNYLDLNAGISVRCVRD